jgi:hypothetical protein
MSENVWPGFRFRTGPQCLAFVLDLAIVEAVLALLPQPGVLSNRTRV